jgi:hypothetical protein
MIPHYRVAEAHALLSLHKPYREQVVVCHGYFFRRRGTTGPSVLDLLAEDRSRRSRPPAPHTRFHARGARTAPRIPPAEDQVAAWSLRSRHPRAERPWTVASPVNTGGLPPCDASPSDEEKTRNREEIDR